MRLNAAVTPSASDSIVVQPRWPLDLEQSLLAAYRGNPELEAILERNPELPGVRLHLGIVHYRMGDATQAREEWSRCLHHDPNDLRARAYLAAVGFAGTAS